VAVLHEPARLGVPSFELQGIEHQPGDPVDVPAMSASHAYDGMNMLIWAIQEAGLNRAKIRDVLAYRTLPFVGVTGEIPLSACLDDLGDVFLARVEGDRWKYYSREDLGVPRGYIAPRSRVPVVTQSPLGQDKQAGN
jgi:hypothetical protein